MKLLVFRDTLTATETTGRLFIDGKQVAYTLEPGSEGQHPRIPEGTYKIGKWFHQSIGIEVPWVMNVPGRDYILIHPGNLSADTEGCLLPGNKKGVIDGKPAVLNSKITFEPIKDQIFAALDRGEEITIQYQSGHSV